MWALSDEERVCVGVEQGHGRLLRSILGWGGGNRAYLAQAGADECHFPPQLQRRSKSTGLGELTTGENNKP